MPGLLVSHAAMPLTAAAATAVASTVASPETMATADLAAAATAAMASLRLSTDALAALAAGQPAMVPRPTPLGAPAAPCVRRSLLSLTSDILVQIHLLAPSPELPATCKRLSQLLSQPHVRAQVAALLLTQYTRQAVMAKRLLAQMTLEASDRSGGGGGSLSSDSVDTSVDSRDEARQRTTTTTAAAADAVFATPRGSVFYGLPSDAASALDASVLGMLRDAAAAVPARLRRKSLSAAGGLFLRAPPATALLENGLLTRQSHRALGTLLVAGTPHGETLLVRLLLSGYAGAIPHVHSTQQLAYGVLAQLPAPLGPSFWRASRRPDGPLYALDLAVRSDWTEAARVWCVLYADSHRLPAAVLDGAVSVAMTCLLLDAGAAVHANDYSALRGAAVGGDLPRLRVLMDAAGSSGPRALAARKGEALARAIAYGHLDVVEFLMAKVKQFQSDPARYPPAWDPPL